MRYNVGSKEKQEKEAMENVVFAVVKTVVDQLTVDEVCALNLCVLLGNDPRHALGYKKARSLFTERCGTVMHDETRNAFCVLVDARTKLFDSE